MQAIILAGGLGTRLRSSVPDLPKCMAPVAGKPFLSHVIAYLQLQRIQSFIFSVGYMHEVIEDFIRKNYPKLPVKFVVETEPLGTGGAIKLSCSKATEENVFVLNDDTMFKTDFSQLLDFHLKNDAACTLALKPMQDFDRYGVVEMDENNRIQSFKEKKSYKSGLINGGVYTLRVAPFLYLNLPARFSFEKDYLEKYYTTQKMAGFVQDTYFIDIGIPEDYERAGRELAIIVNDKL